MTSTPITYDIAVITKPFIDSDRLDYTDNECQHANEYEETHRSGRSTVYVTMCVDCDAVLAETEAE